MNGITRSADVKPAGLNELVLCCRYCVSGWVDVVMIQPDVKGQRDRGADELTTVITCRTTAPLWQ